MIRIRGGGFTCWNSQWPVVIFCQVIELVYLFIYAIRLGVYWGRFRTPVTFKQMPHFFTDDNQITTLFILYSNRLVDRVFVNWHWILKIECNGHILNSQWPVVIFCQAIEQVYLFIYAIRLGAYWGRFGTTVTSKMEAFCDNS